MKTGTTVARRTGPSLPSEGGGCTGSFLPREGGCLSSILGQKLILSKNLKMQPAEHGHGLGIQNKNRGAKNENDTPTTLGYNVFTAETLLEGQTYLEIV